MHEILPERVEGDGLVLRTWTVADVADMGALIAENLDHLRPRMAWVQFEPLGREARTDLVLGWERERLDGGDVVYAIESGGRLVGGTGYHRRVGPDAIELGYWVAHDQVGQGIATRVGRLLTDHAFRVLGFAAVWTRNDRTNVASRRVPEKLGFRLVGEGPRDPAIPGAPADEGIDLLWRIEHHEWSGREHPPAPR